jgi:[acyl-carrier-protein] S-malonyltransferase
MAVVIGLDELAVEEICRETGTKISNVNADDQIVIGGERLALTRAMDLALLRGARRLIRLQVSGAFHTNLMESAAPGMAAALSQLSFRDPRIPIIGNCAALPLSTGEEIKAELLDQLCGCVQWRRSVSYLLDAGVEAFYEIGPGRTLTGLVKKAREDAHLVNVNSLNAIQNLVG